MVSFGPNIWLPVTNKLLPVVRKCWLPARDDTCLLICEFILEEYLFWLALEFDLDILEWFLELSPDKWPDILPDISFNIISKQVKNSSFILIHRGEPHNRTYGSWIRKKKKKIKNFEPRSQIGDFLLLVHKMNKIINRVEKQTAWWKFGFVLPRWISRCKD